MNTPMRFDRSTIGYIGLATIFIQLVIVSYNQYTGYVQYDGPWVFLFRVVFNGLVSMVMAVPLVYVDFRTVMLLDGLLAWDRRPVGRIALEIVLGTVAAVLCSSILTTGYHFGVHPYWDGLPKNLFNNALITAVVNLLILAALEAILALKRNRVAQAKARRLEEENARIRFEVLKDQLNPHFLFNSLNTLSSLIDRDPATARDFVDEFASVYRYTLDVIDRPVIELRRELAYARSYLALQKVRFEGSVQEEICIGAELMDRLIPPLALQTVLENAFKHNAISGETPLRLSIATEGDQVVVRNSLRPKLRPSERKGVGLENLKKRYAFVGDRTPEFLVTGTEYIAKLPLLND